MGTDVRSSKGFGGLGIDLVRGGAAALAMSLTVFAVPKAPDASEELVARSQALLDAVGKGDKQTWDRILADDGLFCDEDGVVRGKAEMLAQIQPLPANMSGSLRIANPKVSRMGEVAVLSYDAMERQRVFEQQIESRYHTTDTYRQISGQWRLVASHTSVLPAEPKPTGVPSPLTDFVGTYRLGGDSSVSIGVSDHALVSTRGERKEVLVSLGGDHFGRPGRPRAERIFIRDGSGKVTSFADRRDNVDLIWTKSS
ncbi:nuclear transport factor 2 family protein [Roseateles sp. NT4]|uniref:nuclear transport factor 2 family protein n=1 Tax=Roseateles sp. NT4 TaxID=3453715 RepID=UPI003EEC0CE8